MNHWTRYSLQASSIILSLVSVVFTVALWSQLPAETWMKFVSGLAGFALELCKFSLLPLAFLFLKNRQTTAGLVLLVIGGALFVVSIGASVTFLETGEQARQQQSAAWQQRQNTLVQLNERIRIGQESAARDIDGGYRQRGLDTLTQVDSWQKQRETLLETPIEQTTGLAGLNDQQRFYAWLLLAILIDGCAVAGWTVLSGNSQQATLQRSPEEQEKPVFSEPAETARTLPEYPEEQEPEQPETITETVTTRARTEKEISETTTTVTVNHEIRDRIVTGEHGSRLTIRGVMEKESIGYKKAKALFDNLEADGVLVNSGKGYQVVVEG